ncbi:MAG TPA: inorganic phosphate transporter, partial [Egibacteraceae bacterium]|nr:inorganic phosphate transporter [Egibacteraceae bacterium]
GAPAYPPVPVAHPRADERGGDRLRHGHGSAAVGAPVSMTQSVAAALVGAGMSYGHRRVRWRAVGRLGLAWLLTLPASAALAAAVARGGALLS